MNKASRSNDNLGAGPTKSRRLKTSLLILKRFVAEHGFEQLRRGTRVEGFHLGHWVTVRRTEYRRGTLPKWLREQLESIPGWTWDPVEARYRRYLKMLRDFGAEYGLHDLTSKTVYRDEPIGVWATCRRVDRRRNKLPKWVKQELEAIPGWSWDPIQHRQLRNLKSLRQFLKLHGWDKFTTRTVVDGINLGAWVNGRRTDHHKGRLDPWLQQQLEEIPGWKWRVRS
jgi:hypothetical protein